MEKKLFSYAIIYNGRKADKDQPEEKSEILVPPSYMLAFNQDEVAFKASRTLDEKWVDKFSDISILVRPF